MNPLKNFFSSFTKKEEEIKKSDTGSNFRSFFEGLDGSAVGGGEYVLANLYEYSPVFNAVLNHTISELINYPLVVYQGEREVKDHWLTNLFKNPNQTSETFGDIRSRFWLYYFIFGRSYIYSPASILSSTSGSHTSMWVKPAFMVNPVIKNGEIVYNCSANPSQFREPIFTEATESEMLAMVALHPFYEYLGVSALRSVAKYCELDYEVAKWNTANTKGSQKIPGVLRMKAFPPDAKTRDEIRKDFKQIFHGRPGELMLLFGDMEFSKLVEPKLDADFVQAVALIIRMICLSMGYPSRLIYPDTGATLSNADIEKEKAHWHTSVLANYVKAEASAYTRFFFPIGDFEVRPNYNASAGYRLAMAETLQRLADLVVKGMMTLNEVRALTGLSPVADKNADTILMDPNKVPISEVGLLMKPVELDPDLTDMENE